MDQTIHHPLEEVFDIQSGTTLVPDLVFTQPTLEVSTESTDTEQVHVYDQRDTSIDSQLDIIQNQALQLAASMKQGMEYADPKFSSRMGEVAIQALNTALDAVKQKSDIKKHKDKLKTTGGFAAVHTTTNNTLVVSRNELLQQLKDGIFE